MFKLSRIVNGRINTSEPHDITLTTAIAAGGVPAYTPVIISGGKVVKVDANSTSVATHVLCRDAEAGDTKVWALDITPEMIFECPLTADVDAAVGAYTEIAVTAAGTAGTAVAKAQASAAQKRGAVLYDTIPANSKTGDTVFVFFTESAVNIPNA